MTGFGDLRATAEKARDLEIELEAIETGSRSVAERHGELLGINDRLVQGRRDFREAFTPDVLVALLDTITAAHKALIGAKNYARPIDLNAAARQGGHVHVDDALAQFAVLVGLPERQEP